MAVEIATAYVNIVPSARGFGRNLSRELGGDLQQAGSNAGMEAGSSFSHGFMSQITGIAEKVGLAVGGLGAAAGTWGLKIASQNEQAQISFETMLGSAEKAGKFLEDLKSFAASTPFEFPELQTAASSLISAGIDAKKVIPIMTSLGNATSGMGTGSEGVKRATIALQQMSAAGRITGEDLNQLRDAGVPVFQLLSAATGKTKEEIAAMAQQGKLGKKEMDQLFAALESGKGLEQFSGLMDKQSQSLEGLFSTFKDVLGQGLAEAMQPVIPILKGVLADVSTALKPFLATVGPILASVVAKLAAGLTKLLPVMAPIMEAFGAVGNALVDALIPAVMAAAPIIREMVDILAGGLIMILQSLGPVLADLITAFRPILPVITKLIATGVVILISLLEELVVALTPVIDMLATDMSEILPELIPLWLDLAHSLTPLFPAFTKLLTALEPLIFLFLTFQTQIMAKFGPLLVPIVQQLVEFARVGVDKIIPALEKIVGWITQLFDAFLKGDQAKIDEIGKQIGDTFSKIWEENLKPNFLKGLDKLKEELGKWWDETGFPWLRDKLQKVQDNIVQWLKDTAPGQIAVASANMFIGIYNSFIDTINAILSAWNGIRFGEVKVGDEVIFEGFTPPQVELLHRLDRFAQGGRPPLGRPSLVGERGPELFVPDSAGTVVPNNALGGLTIEHLEVSGQAQPADTAFAIRRELRWLSMTAGGM